MRPRASGGWWAARGWLVALGALALAACSSSELYGGLDEKAANEMVSALMSAGIEAEKTAGEKGTWGVAVASGDFPDAVQVLQAAGLPRPAYESRGTVFKKEGFNSSPLSEHERLVYAVGEELSDTISRYDGVVDARVHANLPEKEPLSGDTRPASASVFVKYRPGFNVRGQTAAIKTLVTNSIDGLTYDRVSVVMTEAQPPAVAPRTSWTSSVLDGLAWLAALAGLAAAAVAGLHWWRGRTRGGVPTVREGR